MNIAVFQENSVEADLVAELLQKQGYTVKEAPSGMRLLDLLHDEPFDLVVISLKVPPVAGVDLHSAIRRKWSMPIVVLTGLEPCDWNGAASDPNTRILKKRYDPADLLRIVEEFAPAHHGG